MIALQLDMGAFRHAARQMGGALDQVPFALSQAMNEAVKVAREHEVGTVWPRHVTVRNRGFIAAVLRMEFATKRNLSVVLYDRLGRAHLGKHDKGGTKVARGKLAIPTDKVRRTARGVVGRQKPAALPNSFRNGNAIFQRTKTGLQLMYVLAPSARIKPDVPFSREFARVMNREMRVRFGSAMRRAMGTRR